MKKLLCLLCLTLSLIACSDPKPQSYDSYGNAIHLNDYLGKWVVLNVWGTWCKPCIEELPELNQLQKNYRDQLVVVGVNIDGIPNAKINEFAEKFELEFPMLSSFPLKETLNIESIRTVPMTFILDPKGKLVQTLYKPQTADSIAKQIGLTHG